MRRAALLLGAARSALLLALPLPLGACAGESPTLQGAVDSVVAEVSSLLGTTSLPGRHLATLAACHEARGWRFRPDVEDAFPRTLEAVRGLATADYATWREAALVLQVLTTMSEEHPAALVRIECLDTLATIGKWTTAAVPATERRTTEPEVVAAIKRLNEAVGGDAKDPAVVASVAETVDVLAAFRFDESRALPAAGPGADPRGTARTLRSQLNTSRGVLRALTGARLAAFETDPRVRDALDRAFVSVGASAARSAALFAAAGDPDELVRAAAARDLAALRPAPGPAVLGMLLAGDASTSVRREAARFLSAWPAEQTVPALLPGLSDDMPEVRAATVASLASVTGQSFGDDRTAWLRWWQGRTGGAAAPPPGDAPR